MTDFPENNTTQPEPAEESTVFSDPSAHKEVQIKKKKVLPKILAAILCVALLVTGTVAVIKFIPVLDDGQTSSSIYNEISVKKLNSDDIETVSVTNSIGTTQFYSVATEQNDILTEVDWYIHSIDKELTDSSVISNVINALTTITSTRKVTEITPTDCGLDQPAVKAVVTPKNDEAYTVLIGNVSPDNSGFYMMLEETEEIYIISASMVDTLNFSLLDFANTSIIPGFSDEDDELEEYFTNGELSVFDKIIIKGDNHPETVEIVRNDDEEISQYLGYFVKKPTNRIAQNTDALLALYKYGMEVAGAYSYDVKPDTLKKLGLDNPELELKMYVGEKTLTYKFKQQDDGNYAAVYDDSRLVHMVEPDVLSGIIELSTEDYYSTWICYNSIADLSKFTIETEDKEYSFGITKNETDSDSSTASEDSLVTEDYTIIHNGKKLVASNFQYLYGYCITLKCSDYTVHDIGGEPQMKFIFTFKDGSESVIEFRKYSATRYQYTVDGVDMGKVATTSIDKLLLNAEKVSQGKTIGQLT